MLNAHLEYALDDSVLSQRVLRLRIGAADVALACEHAARELQATAAVPGFHTGKAPLALIRKHHAARVEAGAFSSLKHDALEQVFAKLPEKDRPFTPPEVPEQKSIKLQHNRPLEFAVKYLVDPTGLSRQPEHPEAEQGATLPGSQVQHPILHTMGIPLGPRLPAVPGAAPAPASLPAGVPPPLNQPPPAAARSEPEEL